MTSSTDTLTIRRATAEDLPAIERLVQLDSRHVLYGPHLVADAGGHLIAALSLADGRTAADPFVPSAGAVELLRERARHLRGDAERPAGVPALALLRGLFPGGGLRRA